MAGSLAAVATVVFLDLEATGLPPQRPRVTELSLVAVQRASLADPGPPPPRVVNKLQLCFHPEKPISHKSASFNGLTNAMLHGQSSFTLETCQLIQAFLKHLPPPVCLVAHNGNVFDFPLLQAEFHRCQFTAPPELLCVDSLRAFRKLDAAGVAVAAPPTPAAAMQDTPEQDAVDSVARDLHRLLHVAAGKDPHHNQHHTPAAATPAVIAARSSGTKAKKERVSYALGQVYRRLFGSEATAEHTSGGDTWSLMLCAKAYGPAFLQWLDESAVPLNSCRVMYKQ